MNWSNAKQLKAFTLSELLVVLVIIGILVLLALPSLMPLISRTRGLEARKQLKHLQTLQRTYFFEYSRYTDDMIQLGFEQSRLVTDDPPGTANYLIEISEVSPSGFLGKATAVVDFDGDGSFNVWEIDQEGTLVEVQKD
ncbi:MAG: type II secretion system protein [Bacteroidota bacterium]